MKKVKKAPAPPPTRSMLAWAIPVAALAVAGGFLAGQRTGARGEAVAERTTADGAVPLAGGAPTELSAMSPDERASRLYDRVMRYGELHQLDSARFFAPMALQAYAALGAADAHTRYDTGMIWAVVGDSLRARSEAETILNERPTHLLGLLLAMRTAATPALRDSYRRRFVQAKEKELVTALPEYAEHRHDIDGALRTAVPSVP